MPTKTVLKRHSRSPRHKHTKTYLQTYWPYLPMLLIIILGLCFGGSRPFHPTSRGVLAYATDMTSGGLLDATNSQRTSNGVASLSINQQLSSAAQTKANDMVARNYWSHNTPDGQTPWTFIQAAGYKYTKAGENLAYGFATSNDTITGWMNSPTHKANLLDGSFTEVGFGIANGSDYNSSGQETVVVAMYGEPQVLSDSAQASAAPAPPTSAQATPKPAAKAATPAAKPAPTPTPTAAPATPLKTDTTVNTTKQVLEPATHTVTRAGLFSNGQLNWLVAGITLVPALSLIVLLIRHGWGYRRILKDSQKFAVTHPLVDVLLVTLIMTGYVFSATKGFIR